MKLDGVNPSQGAQPTDRTADTRKAGPKAGGKSFADALGKARAGAAEDAAGPGVPAAGNPPAADPATRPPLDAPAADSHIDTIRFRLQTGYYNNPKVDDILSDKLSGYFDDVA